MSKIFKYNPNSGQDLAEKLERWLRENIFINGEKFSFTIEDGSYDIELKWEANHERQ